VHFRDRIIYTGIEHGLDCHRKVGSGVLNLNTSDGKSTQSQLMHMLHSTVRALHNNNNKTSNYLPSSTWRIPGC